MLDISRKIKVPISSLTRAQLENDLEDYGLKGIGEICNIILSNYKAFPLPEFSKTEASQSTELFKNVTPLQFTLWKNNLEFANYANSTNEKIARICRYLFEQYVNLPRGKRECLLKKDELSNITSAILQRRNVTLSYKGIQLYASPCFVAFSPSQVRTYIVICKKNDENKYSFSSLRLIHISGVALDNHSKAFHCENFKLSQQAELFRENFDPFLCYGQKIKIRATSEGVALLNIISTNRPKIISKEAIKDSNDQIIEFECSEKLAQVYFPQFLGNIEILAPASLRLWFAKSFAEAFKKYQATAK